MNILAMQNDLGRPCSPNQTTRNMARLLFHLAQGERLPSYQVMAQTCGIAVGSVSKSLHYFESKGAIQLSMHGCKGTILDKICYEQVFSFVDVKNITTCFPLPYTRRYEGLVTAFYELGYRKWQEGCPPHTITYAPGARARVLGLLDGHYNAVIISRLALDVLHKEGFDLWNVLQFGDKSYVTGHCLIFQLGKDPNDIKNIAFDPLSCDQEVLSKNWLTKNHGIKKIYSPYSRIVEAILRGKIESTIWNTDYIEQFQVGVEQQNIPTLSGETEAVLVTLPDNWGLHSYYQKYFNNQTVSSIQKKVISGEILPQF